MTPTLQIDQVRLLAELHRLATFSEPPAAPASEGQTPVTRIVFTDQDLEARAFLRSLAEAANLSICTDPIGNTFFRWQGSSPELPAIATGSHIDAIPNAGMYDGTVGVLGGLEAIRALQASGFTPRRSIELILFTSEEPTRFGLGCLGSRLLAGGSRLLSAITPIFAEDLPDARYRAPGEPPGLTLGQARQAAGFHGALEDVQLRPNHYAAFVELHIEQGPILEGQRIPIGIVTAIAAPAALNVIVDGRGGHAGALLMPYRHDALTAAAEMILAVEAAALATGAIDTVATVGQCHVFPGNVNAVPSQVRFSVDLRDIDDDRRGEVLLAIQKACYRIATARDLLVNLKLINLDPPATCDPTLVAAIEQACAAANLAYKLMPSRAYHDSLFMARLCPVAMIFIPSRAGVSHRPDEYSTPESIAQGTQILAQTLATLSRT